MALAASAAASICCSVAPANPPKAMLWAMLSLNSTSCCPTQRIREDVAVGHQLQLRTGKSPVEAGAELDRLTARQREILQLIAEGHGTRDIAARLGLSVKTVESHRSQLMDRLDIHDVPGLVRFAVRTGLVSSD